MTIHLKCEHCGSALKIKDEKAGTRANCPKCHAELLIPEAGTPPQGEHVAVLADSGRHARAAEMETVDSAAESLDSDARLIEQADPAASKLAKPRSKPKPMDFDPADFLMEGAAEDGPTTSRSSGRSRFDDVKFDVPASSLDTHADTESPTKTPPPKPKASPAAGTPAEEPVNTHAAAAKRMMKAIKQANAQTLEAREEEQHPKVDYLPAIKEIGVTGVGGVALVLLAACGVYYLANSMMGGGVKLPPLGYVSGTVTLDGKPLSGAFVYFEPADPKFPDSEHQRIRTASGVTDNQGRFELFYLDRIKGAAVGKCRVWLTHQGESGKSSTPGEYQEGAMHMRDVASGSQTIDFAMTSGGAQAAKK